MEQEREDLGFDDGINGIFVPLCGWGIHSHHFQAFDCLAVIVSECSGSTLMDAIAITVAGTAVTEIVMDKGKS